MKKLFALLGLLVTVTAWSQVAATSFDGNYERRDWRGKAQPMLDTDLMIQGNAGSFQAFAPMKSRVENCAGRQVPIEVQKIDGDKITLLVKQSSIMSQCKDITATFQFVTVNGKSGLAIPNTNDIMFVKK